MRLHMFIIQQSSIGFFYCLLYVWLYMCVLGCWQDIPLRLQRRSQKLQESWTITDPILPRPDKRQRDKIKRRECCLLLSNWSSWPCGAMTGWQDIRGLTDVWSLCVSVCVDGVHVGFYTSLSRGHQSRGDTGEIKSLYEGLSFQPGPVTPLINIKYFTSGAMTRDSEDKTSSNTAALETNWFLSYTDDRT